jgi:hypothetical protein
MSILVRNCLIVVALCGSVSCGPDGGNGNGNGNGGGGGGGGGDWYKPDLETTWHWQLQPDAGGMIRTDYDVDLYDIDLVNVDAAFIAELQGLGRKVICYFSAGSFEAFREDADEFEPAEIGQALEDFIDERWLDIRSANVRRIMLARLDLAVTKNCDGVEPDNVDAFENDSGFELTAADQLAYNRFLADAAHERGLAVGLKNDVSQIAELVEDFDFALNEQCHQFDECDTVQPFLDAGKPVFNAEYAARFAGDPENRAALCATARAQGLRTLILPVDLDDSFRYSCDE